MCRFLLALALSIGCAIASAKPVRPEVPCDAPIMLFGGDTVLARGVSARGSTDFATRLRVFFRRVCGSVEEFDVSAESRGRLLDEIDTVLQSILQNERAIAILHYPASDIEAGATVDALLAAYRRVLDACEKSATLCVIGGQQPVNAFTDEQTARQLQLERRAAERFGQAYLPLYRHFQSERGSRRLMLPADSGDGRHIEDLGHEMLYAIYRRRLIEMHTTER